MNQLPRRLGPRPRCRAQDRVLEETVDGHRRRPSSKKLLQSKWTAVLPLEEEKHFVVMRVVGPNRPGGKVERVELRALHSGRSTIVELDELADCRRWHQGWR